MKFPRIIAILAMMAELLSANPVFAEGAIAAARDGQVGLSYNYPGRRSAEERAFEECGRGCRLLTTFRRTCAAVATGERGGYGWATRENLRRAEEAALESCHAEGGRRCRVAARGCDERG